MSYTTVQQGLIRAITNHADFSCNNTVHNDHRSLGDGGAIHAILKYGGFSRQEFSIQRVQHNWTINIELYTRWPGEVVNGQNSADANRQSLLDTINQYPRLADTTGVLRASVFTVNPVEDPTVDFPQYFRQIVTVLAEEVVNPNRQE